MPGVRGTRAALRGARRCLELPRPARRARAAVRAREPGVALARRRRALPRQRVPGVRGARAALRGAHLCLELPRPARRARAAVCARKPGVALTRRRRALPRRRVSRVQRTERARGGPGLRLVLPRDARLARPAVVPGVPRVAHARRHRALSQEPVARVRRTHAAGRRAHARLELPRAARRARPAVGA